MQAAQTFRDLIASGGTVVAPGVFDGLSALLAKQAGFSVLYASGGAIARSTGLPDLGLLSMTEVLATVRQIVSVCQMPVVVDIDTGFGNRLNVERTVKDFAQADVAAFHLEDQTFPKRCGHLDNKTLISSEEMCEKITAAKQCLPANGPLLIARTDAIAVEGFAAALTRAEAYMKAGADMLFVEAPTSREQIEQIAKTLPGPKLINMFYGGKTPLVPVDELQTMGYNLVIIPSDLQRAAIKAMQKTLHAIHKQGSSIDMADELVSFKEREAIIGTETYLK